jgi:hypothetical protein
MIAEETKERILRADNPVAVIELLTIVFNVLDELKSPPKKVLDLCDRLEAVLNKAKEIHAGNPKKIINIDAALTLINLYRQNIKNSDTNPA